MKISSLHIRAEINSSDMQSLGRARSSHSFDVWATPPLVVWLADCVKTNAGYWSMRCALAANAANAFVQYGDFDASRPPYKNAGPAI